MYSAAKARQRFLLAMLNAQVLEILVIAMVAGIILFRLYSVLGRRTGHERPPQDSSRFGGPPKAAESAGNVVPLPARVAADSKTRTEAPSDSVGRALLDIKLADRGFETEHFLSGARKAYEMVVTAFARGDRATLKPLLSAEVFAAFDSGITAREQRHETMSYTFVGLKDAKIAHAALKGETAEITVSFQAQFISATTNPAGEVVEGDARAVREVNDVWTFARDVRAQDPNWILIATSGSEP